MAENQDNTGGQNIPPKLVIKPLGVPPAQPGFPASALGQPPATVRMKAPPPAESAAAPDSQKKATSKIPLSEAVAGPDSTVKTIRLQPAKPGTITPPATPPNSAAGTAEKRKTSRISLDAVLGSEGDAPADDQGPKTIRLKKPSELATVKVGQSAPATPVKGDTTAIAEGAAESKKNTQAIPAVDEGDDSSATRRRTIRVKRAGGAGKVELGSEAPAAAASQPDLEESVEDRPHGVFIFSAVAAIVVGLVLVYVLTAQAFGPNVCLTQLSYGTPSLDLAWPGKLVGGR
jgi:hypothetical protein